MTNETFLLEFAPPLLIVIAVGMWTAVWLLGQVCVRLDTIAAALRARSTKSGGEG